jgi:hypothetical protein
MINPTPHNKQIVGKALFDDQLLDCHFTLSMYKHMLKEVNPCTLNTKH